MVLTAAVAWSQAGGALPNQIVLGVGFGELVPLAGSIIPASVARAVEPGIDGDLIRRILIEEIVRERFLVEFDYDGAREGGFLGSENTYALTYTGTEQEVLKEVTLGNKDRSLAPIRTMPLDAGSKDSYALRVRAGSPEGGPEDGPSVGVDALLRYGASTRRSKRFRGARQLVEARILEVDYLKRRGYLLPDPGVDEASLQVLRSGREGAEVSVDGRRFTVLSPGVDFRLDNVAGRVLLTRALSQAEELAVYYERGGVAVGSPSLGSRAIVAESGVRADFSSAAFPEYFGSDGERTWLYLRREGVSSYWELKNLYAVEGLEGSEDPGPVALRIVLSASGLENGSYRDLVGRYSVDPTDGVVSFEPRDAWGFYPRPFPGARPFTDPDAPVNPFAPDNPIYGGLGDPAPSASVNTLVFRFSPRREELFLDYDILERSVRVQVDGAEIAAGLFSVDYDLGTVSFAAGVVSPSSDVEVSYSVAVPAAELQELVGAVGVDLEAAPLVLRAFSTARLPLRAEQAPRIGEGRIGMFAAGVDVRMDLGAPEGTPGPSAKLAAGAAVMAGVAGAPGVALVADMESGASSSVSTQAEYWILGSRSLLLGSASPPTLLGARGPLRYRDYWRSSLVGGGILEPVSWDDSGNPAFSYAEKAGPYNTADTAPGREERALVLEFDFDLAGDAVPYVSAATSLGGQNLAGAGVLHAAMRGYGVSGGAVRVYLEVLRVYEEDLNANDSLDGETSVLQSGLPITPLDGTPTVIGTGRDGRADGRIASEDLDGNLQLDPPGPYALDVEEGVVAGGAGGVLAEIGPGDEAWHTVSLDLRDLIRAHPRVFQEARALRLTVTSAPGSRPTRGRVLVGGIWFAASGVRNLSPEYLAVQEVSTRADDRVAADAFSLSYPDVYASLHGSAKSRADRGHDERTLVTRLTASLPDGARAAVAAELAAPASLTPYGRFAAYVFLPAWPAPAQAVLRLVIESTPLDYLAAEVPAGELRQGWNELAFGIGTPYDLAVNGRSTGAVGVGGSGGILSAVRAFRLEIEARGGEIPEGFELWLDEWHMGDARVSLDTAVYGEASLGYRGAALVLSLGRAASRSWPLLGDAFIRAGYERRAGGLADTPDVVAGSWWIGHELVLLNVLRPRLRIGGSWTRPDLEPSVVERAETSTWSYGIGLDTGVPWLPVLDHAYHSTVSEGTRLGLGESGYGAVESLRGSRSVTFEERMRYDPVLAQSYLFTRAWEYASAEGAEAGESLRLTETHDARLQLLSGQNRASANFLREERWTSGAPAFDPLPVSAYLSTMAAALRPGAEAVPAGSLSARADKASLELSLPRRRFVGAAARTEATYRERDSDASLVTRDAELTSSLNVSLPFSPGGRGDLQVTVTATHTLAASCSDAPASLTELGLLGLGYPLLLRPPLYYLGLFVDWARANALDAVGMLAQDQALARLSSARLTAATGLSLEFRSAPWFLPSRAGLSLESATSRSGFAYAQTGDLVARVGKTLVVPRAGALPLTASADLTYRFGRIYATKVTSQSVVSAIGLGLPVFAHGGIRLDGSVTYGHERQRVDDPRLTLWPGGGRAEPATAARPDRRSLESVVGVELWSERPVEGVRSQLLFRSLPAGGERLGLRGRVELENAFVWTDASRVAPYTNVPLKATFTQSTVFRQSDYLSLELSLKAVAGAEDLVWAAGTTRVPAFGFEMQANVELRF